MRRKSPVRLQLPYSQDAPEASLLLRSGPPHLRAARRADRSIATVRVCRRVMPPFASTSQFSNCFRVRHRCTSSATVQAGFTPSHGRTSPGWGIGGWPVLSKLPLADVPAIIWQIGTLETCLHTMRVSRPERFDRFVAHLLQYYPARHEVSAIYCSPHPLMPPTMLRFALEDMGQHAREIHAGFTLYVPPALGRPVQDSDLVAKLYRVEHLRRITGS